jgi:hypothetical protein
MDRRGGVMEPGLNACPPLVRISGGGRGRARSLLRLTLLPLLLACAAPGGCRSSLFGGRVIHDCFPPQREGRLGQAEEVVLGSEQCDHWRTLTYDLGASRQLTIALRGAPPAAHVRTLVFGDVGDQPLAESAQPERSFVVKVDTDRVFVVLTQEIGSPPARMTLFVDLAP